MKTIQSRSFLAGFLLALLVIGGMKLGTLAVNLGRCSAKVFQIEEFVAKGIAQAYGFGSNEGKIVRDCNIPNDDEYRQEVDLTIPLGARSSAIPMGRSSFHAGPDTAGFGLSVERGEVDGNGYVSIVVRK